MRVDLEAILVVPDDVGGATGLRADVVLAEDAAGGQEQREAPLLRSSVGTYSVT